METKRLEVTMAAIKDSSDNFMLSRARGSGRGVEKSKEMVRVKVEFWRRTTKVTPCQAFIFIHACVAVHCRRACGSLRGISGQRFK